MSNEPLVLGQPLTIAGCRMLRTLEDRGQTRSFVASYLETSLVVVKVYEEQLWRDAPAELARYEWHCRAMLGLRHPALPVTVRFGHRPDLGWRYLVQEYVFGSSLRQVRQDLRRPFTPGEAAEVLFPIADALVLCHAHELPHGRLSDWHISLTETDRGPRSRLLGIRPLLGAVPPHSTGDAVALARIAYGITAQPESPPVEAVLAGDYRTHVGRDAAWNETLELGLFSSAPETSMAELRDALEDIRQTAPDRDQLSDSLAHAVVPLRPPDEHLPALDPSDLDDWTEPDTQPIPLRPTLKERLKRFFLAS